MYSEEDDVKPAAAGGELKLSGDEMADKLFRTIDAKQEKLKCSLALPCQIPHYLGSFRSEETNGECSVNENFENSVSITYRSNACDHHDHHPCGLSLYNWNGHQIHVPLSTPEDEKPITRIFEESEISPGNYYYVVDQSVNVATFPKLLESASRGKKGYEIKRKEETSEKQKKIKIVWYKCYQINKESLNQVLHVIEDGIVENQSCLPPGTLIGHNTASLLRDKIYNAYPLDCDDKDYYCVPDVVQLDWQLHCFRITATAEPLPLHETFDRDTWYICTLLYQEFIIIDDKYLVDEVAGFLRTADEVNYQLMPSLYRYAESICIVSELMDSLENFQFLLSYSKKLKILSNLQKVPPWRPVGLLCDAAKLIRSHITCCTLETADILINVLMMLDSTDYAYVYVPRAADAVTEFYQQLRKNSKIEGIESLVELIKHLQQPKS